VRADPASVCGRQSDTRCGEATTRQRAREASTNQVGRADPSQSWITSGGFCAFATADRPRPQAGTRHARVRRVTNLLTPEASDDLVRTALLVCDGCDVTAQFDTTKRSNTTIFRRSSVAWDAGRTGDRS